MMVFGRRGAGTNTVSAASYSVLDAQCTVRGDVASDGTLRIDGRLEGNILRAALLVVGAQATIIGNIAARELVVGGTVEGNIMAESRVELEASASVVGDIAADAILVHEGARIDGRLLVRSPGERASGEHMSADITAPALPKARKPRLAIAAPDA